MTRFDRVGSFRFYHAPVQRAPRERDTATERFQIEDRVDVGSGDVRRIDEVWSGTRSEDGSTPRVADHGPDNSPPNLEVEALSVLPKRPGALEP